MGCLAGIKVIDLSNHLAGPYASVIMADMGAEVIRIEQVGGDFDRRFGYSLSTGDSASFVCRARNKKSITLNLRFPEGLEILRKLVRISDVLLENFGPATRESLNIEYESLKQINPELIMASISAYGSWGPSKNKIGFDPIAQAACSSMSFNGFSDDERPVRAAVPWVDYSTALHACVGILLALWHREKTGKGQHIDVSLYDTAVNLVGMQGVFVDYLVHGVLREKLGNASFYTYADAFRAKDGWIFVHLGRNTIWQRFVKLIGREELGSDPRFSDDARRVENRNLIENLVKPWVADRRVDEIADLLEKARVPCQKINTIPETLADPHLRARDMLLEMEYVDDVKVPIPGIVIKLSESPGKIRSRAPLLGEHNEEIIGERLGYSKEEISRLKKMKII